MSFSSLDSKNAVITYTPPRSEGGQMDPDNPGTRLAAEAAAPVTIEGHITFSRGEDSRVDAYTHDESGQQDEGKAFLWTSHAVAIGGDVKWVIGSNAAEYKVTGVGFVPMFMPGGRTEYVLELKEAPAAWSA